MPKKILIVEDDLEYQDLLEAILCPLYETTIVASAEAAFENLDQKHFDLIITDINLFGMTGFEVLGRIKNTGLEQETPVIICSSDSHQFTKEKAMKLGAAGFVTKPFSHEALCSLLHALLH